MTPGCPNLWSLANTVKASASSMQAGVDHKDWQTFSSDRVEWRLTNQRAAQQLEDFKVNTAMEK